MQAPAAARERIASTALAQGARSAGSSWYRLTKTTLAGSIPEPWSASWRVLAHSRPSVQWAPRWIARRLRRSPTKTKRDGRPTMRSAPAVLTAPMWRLGAAAPLVGIGSIRRSPAVQRGRAAPWGSWERPQPGVRRQQREETAGAGARQADGLDQAVLQYSQDLRLGIMDPPTAVHEDPVEQPGAAQPVHDHRVGLAERPELGVGEGVAEDLEIAVALAAPAGTLAQSAERH